MHTYDSSRWPSYAAIPPARPGQDPQSATPIYDALYTEYVKSFRALPGDRSGEEELGFTAFGGGSGHGGGYAGGVGGYAASHTGTYSAYSAGAQSARQQGQWQRVGTLGQQQPYQYQGTQNLPALPPGPRRGY